MEWLPCNLLGCIFLPLYLLLLDELISFTGLLLSTTTITISSKSPSNGDPFNQSNVSIEAWRKWGEKINVQLWAQSVEVMFKTIITHFYLVLQRYLFDIMSIFECIIQNFKVNMSPKYRHIHNPVATVTFLRISCLPWALLNLDMALVETFRQHNTQKVDAASTRWRRWHQFLSAAPEWRCIE